MEEGGVDSVAFSVKCNSVVDGVDVLMVKTRKEERWSNPVGNERPVWVTTQSISKVIESQHPPPPHQLLSQQAGLLLWLLIYILWSLDPVLTALESYLQRRTCAGACKRQGVKKIPRSRMGMTWPTRPGKGHVSWNSCLHDTPTIMVESNPRLLFTFHSPGVPVSCYPQATIGSWNSKKQTRKRDTWENGRDNSSFPKRKLALCHFGAFQTVSQVRKISFSVEGRRDQTGVFVKCLTLKNYFKIQHCEAPKLELNVKRSGTK